MQQKTAEPWNAHERQGNTRPGTCQRYTSGWPGLATTAPLLPTVPHRTFTVAYRYSRTITGAALAAPCANTHSINMGQRVIKLLVGLSLKLTSNVGVHQVPPGATLPLNTHSVQYIAQR